GPALAPNPSPSRLPSKFWKSFFRILALGLGISNRQTKNSKILDALRLTRQTKVLTQLSKADDTPALTPLHNSLFADLDRIFADKNYVSFYTPI
ncbi:MAG: hypothetical protein ACXWC9_06175, partial [Pseudobdellovibrionaceae bacterium]